MVLVVEMNFKVFPCYSLQKLKERRPKFSALLEGGERRRRLNTSVSYILPFYFIPTVLGGG